MYYKLSILCIDIVSFFLATKIWHEYCQFVMNNIESPADIERARNVFENAITAVGLHVTEVSKK